MHVTAAEPFLPDVLSDRLETLAVELPLAAGRFSGGLPSQVRAAVGELVRSMNCYYSNLIEGHNTHPHDIDRALEASYSRNAEKRALQKEARAHIEVQRMIDANDAPEVSPLSRNFIEWTHREFCSRLPPELLVVQDSYSHETIPVVPGELRKRAVIVGLHVPPPPENLPAFLDRFEAAYRSASLLKQLIGVAASHHRLLWIHPFLDGNGRVARLMSHALLKQLGIGSTLWSVSRGLARSVGTYKANLQAADEPRQGDLDGRGNLSRKNLTMFCEYFLEQCLDQVHFMQGLLNPESLRDRVQHQVNAEERNGTLAAGAHRLMRAAVEYGEIARGEVPAIVQASERTGQRITKSLLENGYLSSANHTAPLLFSIPSIARDYWFPALYSSSETELICESIRERRLLEFDYGGMPRTVEPVAHGRSAAGVEILRAREVAVSRISSSPAIYKLWRVRQMTKMRILNQSFQPDATSPSDDPALQSIHCHV